MIRVLQSRLLGFVILLISAWLAVAADEAKPEGAKQEEPPMLIMPAPKAVAIDGELKEWDKTGKIGPVTFDEEVKDEYNGTFYAMYDSEFLYLAAVIMQPHPPYNLYPNKGVGAWNADDIIIRMSSDPKLSLPIQGTRESMKTSPELFTADFWWNHQAKRPYWDGYYGMGGEMMTAAQMPGIAMAVKTAADGKGYTSEIKIPLKIINPAFHPQAGD